MKIETLNGFCIIDPKLIGQVEFRENDKVCEIYIQYKGYMGMNYIFMVKTKEYALQKTEEIAKYIKEADSVVEEKKDYIDGFKAGTEYALKLKE